MAEPAPIVEGEMAAEAVAESREVAERLQEWLHEGPDLFRRLIAHLRILQEHHAGGGDSETTRWQPQAETAREESDRLGRELQELRAEHERLRQETEALRTENEQLRGQRYDWDAMVGSVNETTRRMNDMIAKLRASRRNVL